MQYYEIDHFYLNKDSLPVLGDQDFKEVLKDIIYIIPKDILDDVLSNCFFLMLSENVPAATIPKKLIIGKSILAFYNMLYSQDKDKQVDMILHEIAHYFLGHADDGLLDEPYYKQEEEANSKKDKWVKAYEEYILALKEESMKPWKGGL